MSSQRVGFGLKLDRSLKVTEVVPGGPCDGKLQCGDVISNIDGSSVSRKSLAEIVPYTQGAVGSRAVIWVRRGDQLIEVEIIRKFNQVESLKDTLDRQLKLSLQKRASSHIKAIFNKYATNDSKVPSIPKDNLLLALKEFDAVEKDVTEGDVSNVDFLFSSLDRNNDGILDFDEFKTAVQNPSALEDWTRSLPLAEMLADVIPRKQGDEPLRAASSLSSQQIAVVCEVFAEGLKTVLTQHVQRLRDTFLSLDNSKYNPAADKFESNAPKMSCGTIDDFYLGLSARIGNAHLDFEAAMELEHCHQNGFDQEFETTNYKIRTCPAKEWGIVLGVQECPPEQRMWNRKIPNVKELLTLDIVLEAKLTRAEVIAVVLYTGPMFYVYNTILRHYPEDHYQRLRDTGNCYPNTIFVLASAVQKLARVTKVDTGMTLYRGLNGDVDMPGLFFKCDEHGCTGFTEWGFMSTSSSMEVALQYSGVDAGRRRPRVLVISVGSVDRGARIGPLSQYEEEHEFLYVPCSFVEKAGPLSVKVTSKGIVEMIPVKVNANLKAKTVDELLEQKKDTHLAAFSHHIDQVKRELRKIAADRGAEARISQDKSADTNHTVEGFLNRIEAQCKEVLARHKAVNRMDYVNDRAFRSLVLEMIDVKAMAICKLEEWLENKSGSFIRFRWNASLRTVHRRWISLLYEKRQASGSPEERKGAAVLLCKALGLFAESVEEKNDLNETRLMSAAAEGLGGRFLRLLVDAGASVNSARPDGVTPMWLAAQSGHSRCVRALHGLNADVRQAANDGATPVYMAARNGKTHCIEVLFELRADVSATDKRGSGPLHQAALYGHNKAIEMLVKLGADINARDHKGFSPWDVAHQSDHEDCATFILTQGGRPPTTSPHNYGSMRLKRLIISTGDISDIDGFLALAEYAKTDADVLFVMNYPAYIGIEETDVDPNYATMNPGLGYKYSAEQVFSKVPQPAPEHYTRFLEPYANQGHNQCVKSAMTDLAFAMANGVWSEGQGHGKLFFAVGGINAINPFSESAIKNEVLIYSKIIEPTTTPLSTEQGTVYASDGSLHYINWKEYWDIYMDFNGSLAFWNGFLANRLSEKDVVNKIRGVFIMGGVHAEDQPVTSQSIPNVLNRFSSATMNQLYHPQNASDFFAFLAQFNIPTYTITNNVVKDLDTFDGDGTKTYTGVENFLSSNELKGEFLKKLTDAHYLSPFDAKRKPFDYYAAFALRTLMIRRSQRFSGPQPGLSYFQASDDSAAVKDEVDRTSTVLPAARRTLFYSNVYGVTFVSRSEAWEVTRAAFTRAVDVQARADDPQAKSRKEHFKRELELLKTMDLASMPVLDLSFQRDDSMALSLTAPRQSSAA